MINDHHIKIKSTPKNIVLVEEFILTICNDKITNTELLTNILVAVTEAVNNAIYHGNQCKEELLVKLSYSFNNDLQVISFFIQDEGTGFDYKTIPNPTLPHNIKMTGGRGVFLINKLADKAIYNNNGSTLELQFKI